MRDSGIVVASIIINGKAELATKPLIVMPGLLDPKEDEVIKRMLLGGEFDHGRVRQEPLALFAVLDNVGNS